MRCSHCLREWSRRSLRGCDAKTGSTDGNLGAQLLKLEEAGYVAVEKKFVLRKPQTIYRITEHGRQELGDYVQALKQLLGCGDYGLAGDGSPPRWLRDRRALAA